MRNLLVAALLAVSTFAHADGPSLSANNWIRQVRYTNTVNGPSGTISVPKFSPYLHLLSAQAVGTIDSQWFLEAGQATYDPPAYDTILEDAYAASIAGIINESDTRENLAHFETINDPPLVYLFVKIEDLDFTGIKNYSTPADLTPLIGVGTVDFPYSVAAWLVPNPLAVEDTFLLHASGTVVMVYTYSIH